MMLFHRHFERIFYLSLKNPIPRKYCSRGLRARGRSADRTTMSLSMNLNLRAFNLTLFAFFPSTRSRNQIILFFNFFLLFFSFSLYFDFRICFSFHVSTSNDIYFTFDPTTNTFKASRNPYEYSIRN